ncbi:hypothetical protein AYK26_06170 [Euryarchaeota archaeon SM23-78]|nr:MAG: hypothetical protein AYK26_06170 [Euryarchaeota archaeon SM23-78]MBW3001212.1 hypothetical protein [Candidatus Woesearchaeota archaeon]
MKLRILFFVMVLLLFSQFVLAERASLVPPFSFCSEIGLKLEVQRDINRISKLPVEEAEQELEKYNKIGEECCELTIAPSRCEAYFRSIHPKNQGGLIFFLVFFVIISVIGLVSIIHMLFVKIFNNKYLTTIPKIITAVIVILSALIIVMFIYSVVMRTFFY